MAWEAVAAPDMDQDLIVFDGDCVLCSHWARFVHDRDVAHRFKFVAIQSPFGRALAARFDVDADAPRTNLAALEGRVYFKSDAAIEILGALPGWRWSRSVRVAPRAFRNWLYDNIARRRYRWFGRKEQCWAGDPAFTARILDSAL
ncbi:MAG: DCC1-like thiol-disulfide oxidoreductase family protein [Hyphomonadaceae bacterium]